MRFDSAEFLLFFAVVLVLHHVLAQRRWLLISASYLFYASWNPPFLLLLLFSTALDYFVGLRLERAESVRRRRWLLAVSLVGNLGVLAYFKYVNFFLDLVVDAGLAPDYWLRPFYVRAQIPLGISFYTFQTLSYAIDVYRKRMPACRSFADFALFVAFFPQLLAGPVMRAGELLPQIRRDPRPDESQTIQGIELCLVGLFKKVVLADNFALLVDQCFADPEMHSGLSLLLGTFAFSVQIFCDFSGYSTMARGLGRMLGYQLPINFGYPFLAGSPVDYRRDWHITMGTWFRDYVYRPLGGDRLGLRRTLFNTLVTWTLFGFWHGASWTFLLWGLYNGVLLSVYRALQAGEILPTRSRIATVAGYLSMPIFIGFANIFFRAPDVDTALTMINRILSWSPGTAVTPAWGVGLVALYLGHWASRLWYDENLLLRMAWVPRLAACGAFLAVLYLGAGSGAPFYYFQF